jgi:hypothetical protein
MPKRHGPTELSIRIPKHRQLAAKLQETREMKQDIRWGNGKYEERNARVFETVLKGRTYRDVAQENGLSRERIRQIVGKYRRKTAKMLFAQTGFLTASDQFPVRREDR